MEKEKGGIKKMKEKYVECLVYSGPILYLVYIIYLNNHKTLPNPCYYLWFTKEEIVWFVESHTNKRKI